MASRNTGKGFGNKVLVTLIDDTAGQTFTEPVIGVAHAVKPLLKVAVNEPDKVGLPVNPYLTTLVPPPLSGLIEAGETEVTCIP